MGGRVGSEGLRIVAFDLGVKVWRVVSDLLLGLR
jgi:hypothetical protein